MHIYSYISYTRIKVQNVKAPYIFPVNIIYALKKDATSMVKLNKKSLKLLQITYSHLYYTPDTILFQVGNEGDLTREKTKVKHVYLFD